MKKTFLEDNISQHVGSRSWRKLWKKNPPSHPPNRNFVDYLSVQEAARILGVSARSVYGYIAKGKLPATRMGERILVKAQDISVFERSAPGRARTDIPLWHVPPLRNLQYLTTITVRVLPGQGELLERRLYEFRATQKHRLPGTAARYIVRNEQDPGEIAILLFWRSLVLPPADERADSIAGLAADLADVLDWQTASLREGLVLLHA
jgi:excisionase family DNA binding protein